MLQTPHYTITAKQFRESPGQEPECGVFLWTHIGNGTLYEVESITPDWWIRVVGGRSFCCTPETTLYVTDDYLYLGAELAELLAKQRASFAKA